MKKIVILTGVLLAMSFSMAYAVGLNLGWASSTAVNDCPNQPTSSANKNFACGSNAGAEILIGSVVAPGGLNDVVGQSLIVDYQENQPTLSDWWNFAGCRSTPTSSVNLTMSFDPLIDDGFCNNLWGTNAASAFSYAANNPGPGLGHLTMVGAVPTSLGMAMPAGTEWYSFRLVLDNRHTVASTLPTCAGCQNGALFAFNYLQLNNVAGTGVDAELFHNDPNGRQCVTWQGGGGLVCPGIVPTHRATWGEVKSLYR